LFKAVILEADAVREALFMLQDNASIFTSVVESGPLNLPKIQESDPSDSELLLVLIG